MKRALYILAIILISACGSRSRNVTADSEDIEDIEVTVLDSDDGNVRVLSWEAPHDGTMGVYGSPIFTRIQPSL